MPADNAARVHVVDDDAAVRDSLAELMESAGLPSALYASAEEFLGKCCANAGGCLLLDIRMSGLNGLDLQQELRARGVDLPVIVITGHGDVPVATRAFKQGAVDFVQKPFDPLELLDAVRAALAQHERTQECRAGRAAILARLARLSAREREVLDLVTAGLANKQIAAALHLAERTIEFHRAHLMEKMAAGSIAQLVQMVVAARGADTAAPFL
jgi:two-component system, LuxR family, response regulator FixJ